MARRVREYTGMLLDRLIRNDVMAREGGLPRTLAVVVYNGGERWTAIGEEIPPGGGAVGAGGARPGAAAAATLPTH